MMTLSPGNVLPTQERVELHEAHTEPEFWLFFNARGEIAYCSALLLRLLGVHAADIKGTAVTSILPELPVVAAKPEDNVASLMLNYVGRRHGLQMVLDEGRRVAVEASINSVNLGSGNVFVVELSFPGRLARPRRGC